MPLLLAGADFHNVYAIVCTKKYFAVVVVLARAQCTYVPQKVPILNAMTACLCVIAGEHTLCH